MTNNIRTDFDKYYAPVLGRQGLQDKFDFYGELVSDGNRSLALDGVGIVHGKLATQVSDLFGLRSDYDLLSIRGSVVIYSKIESDLTYFKINPDPIGAAIVYKYEKDGVVAFSSDLNHLVEWLMVRGIKAKKSVFYQALMVAMNDGGFGYSSYEDVVALESSKYVVAYNSDFHIHDYGLDNFLKEKDSYENLLRLAESEIKNNINSITISELEKIVHLTGGMDSRLVVAAIQSVNQIDNYKVFCSGGHGYPDFDTAYSICGAMGIKMTNKSTLEQKESPTNFEEYYKWSSDFNQGVLPNQPLNLGVKENRNIITLSGGYGECLRGYYEHAVGYPLLETINKIWPFYDDKDNVRVPVTEFVVEQIKKQSYSFLVNKIAKGWCINDALQLIYLEEKNRYFVGNISLHQSRKTPRFDPLYSLYGIKAAYNLEFIGRVNKELVFDLMSRFNKQVALFEFGTTKWSDALLQKKNVSTVKLPPVSTKEVIFEWHELKNEMQWLSKVSKESKQEAIRIGAPAWQVENYLKLQEASKEIILKNPDFYQYFDKVRVGRLLNNKLSHRQHIRKVFQVYYALVFLYK